MYPTARRHFGYGQKDNGKEDSPTPTATTFGRYSHDLGGGLAIWYEGQVNDDDDDANNDDEFKYESIHRVGLRYIF